MSRFDSRDLMVTTLIEENEFANCPVPTKAGTQCAAGKCTCCTNPSSTKKEKSTDDDLAALEAQLAAAR